MTKITIKTQAELDALPERFDEYTIIEIRSEVRIVVKKALGNSSVVARENSSVEAWGNSSVVARENSSVEAWGNSSVEAWGNSSVEAWGNSSVEAWGNSSVVARENSSVVARGNSSVEARGNASVEAWGNSSVVARENSSVVAYQFAMIAVLSAAVVIKHLADWAVASIRGVSAKIEKKDETATVIETPQAHELEISFETWLERGYVFADGIYQKFISRKKVGDIEVFTVQNFPKKKESVVVRRGETFSHGKTVEEAIKDLRYKISERDTSEFDSWTLDTKVSIDDAIQSYRVITGACEFGTKQFCQGIELPEEITVSEVIEKTKGQFGNEQYEKFFLRGGAA